MKKFEINDRIIELMKTQGVDEADVASLIGKDKSTVYRITGKNVIPSKTTVKLIADKYGVDYNYLLTGKMQQVAKEMPWKEEAYALLKAERDYFKERYTKVIDAVISGNLGKLLALKSSGKMRKVA